MLFLVLCSHDQTYLPAKKKKKSKNSRISEKNAYISRARCHSKKKGQKTHSPHRLMSPTRLQGQELILIVNQSHDSKTNQSWPKPKVVISKKTVNKASPGQPKFERWPNNSYHQEKYCKSQNGAS